jgi:hypothetical protein
MGFLRPGVFLPLVLLFFPGLSALWPQTAAEPAPAVSETDPASLIGLSLENMLSRFGTPQGVYAIRGNEEWQDDVVFVYESGDFYVFKDRVWQIGLKAAYGIRLGDPRRAVSLALGEGARESEDHILFPLPAKGWPLALRVNFDPSGLASALFVYRPGF